MTRKDRELDEEIRSHIEMAARDRIDRGRSPAAAAHEARREFGNIALVKEVTREMWGGLWLDRLVQDLRSGARLLRRRRRSRSWPWCRWRWASARTPPSFSDRRGAAARAAGQPPADLAHIQISHLEGAPAASTRANPRWPQIREQLAPTSRRFPACSRGEPRSSTSRRVARRAASRLWVSGSSSTCSASGRRPASVTPADDTRGVRAGASSATGSGSASSAAGLTQSDRR